MSRMNIYILFSLLMLLNISNCMSFSSMDNHFDWRLIKEVTHKSTENRVISPFGVKLLASLLMQTTAGKTNHELFRNLMPHRNILQTPQYFYDVLHVLQPQNKTKDLNIISNIFIDSDSVTLARKSFGNACIHYYKAYVVSTPFGKPKETAKKVNKFYSLVSEDKIKSIVTEDDFESAQILFLNAIQFEGEWKYPFTEQENGFFNTGEDLIETILMKQSNDFNLIENELFSMLELPYKNNNLSMHIILPNDDFNLTKTLTQLDAEKFQQLKNSYKETNIDVMLPKFKIENSMKLHQILYNLGIKSVFSDIGEFDEFIPGNIKVSNILHKAEIAVDEKGTKAQASTKISFNSRFGTGEFRVNKPFLFLIENKETGAILFSGSVFNPKY